MPQTTIITVIGARPQFIKAAAVSRAIAAHNRRAAPGRPLREFVVHTGQHYDREMSQVFFDELGIPEPDANLGVGSGTHARQTAAMLTGVESVLMETEHAALLVYGDTNSTLAGALAAAKLHTPVLHVEAGLRSFNRRMPEEVNRVLTDHMATLLFCPTARAVDNLRKESVTAGVHLVGDVMCDSLLHCRDAAAGDTRFLEANGLVPEGYVLATVHRSENTDQRSRLEAILQGFGHIARQTPVALALHPCTRSMLEKWGLSVPEGVRVLAPVPYMQMVQLEDNALGVMTDSGGMQKEAYLLGVPCCTLRGETEWVETLRAGANILCGADPQAMARWHGTLLENGRPPAPEAPPYGDGRAAPRIVEHILDWIGQAP